MRVEKMRAAPDKLEFPAFELFPPVARELVNQAAFACEHFRLHHAHVLRAQPEFLRSPQRDEPVGRFDHRFRGHATAQDAQPAHVFAAFDHDCSQTEAARGARRRVPGAPTADHGKIVRGFSGSGRVAGHGGGSREGWTS